MSNIEIIIEERAASIGSFMVGRLLPFKQKRMVGPFIFIDHMGPVKMSDRDGFDVQPHPHIGLSTLTYLFEGSIMHRDSLGNAVEIKPGEVNWMTAGRGIVHSERTPDYLRGSEIHLHGLQVWVALPKDLEQMPPEFSHTDKSELPVWNEGTAQFKLIAGEAFGRKSPIPVFSKFYMLEIHAPERQKLAIGNDLYGESGLYILEGSVHIEGNKFLPKQILVAKESTLCAFEMDAGSTIYLFGGDTFPEERYIDWNFVSSSKELISQARDKWINRQFNNVVGDEIEFVPYPPFNLKIKK